MNFRRAEPSIAPWHACRWEGPSEHLNKALKCVECSKAHHVDNVRHEYEMLRAATAWDGCVGGGGIFWEPWFGKDGARKGTKYHLAMKCAPCPAGFIVLPRVPATTVPDTSVTCILSRNAMWLWVSTSSDHLTRAWHV